MRTNKNYLYASFIFTIVLISVLVLMYFTSAQFSNAGELILPNEDTSEDILYENRHIIADVEIDIDNFKEVIMLLKRPYEYSARVVNTIYAFGESKVDTSYIYVSGDKLKVEKDNRNTIVSDEVVNITENGESMSFDKVSFTNDEIMGIKTFEDLIEYDDIREVEYSDNIIKITRIDGDITEHYYVSLISGILEKYTVIENEIIIRESVINNLSIQSISEEIFIIE